MISIDFEIYSTAGYLFDSVQQRWRSVSPSPPHGLSAVGAAAYAEHPSTEVLCLAYDLGTGPTVWIPGMPEPVALFDHIGRGGLVAAWNSMFEYLVWLHVGVRRLKWPPLPLTQLRDTMARSYAHSLPGALANACAVIGTTQRKDADGKRLLRKFSWGHQPSKKDPRTRIRPEDDPPDAVRLYQYCLDDVRTEAEIGSRLPELSDFELEVWKLDQVINARGVHIDREGLEHLKSIVADATTVYEAELVELTAGDVTSGGELAKMQKWLAGRGVLMDNLQADTVAARLADPILPPDCRRVLELRQRLSMSSVKKIYAIERRLSGDGRLRGLFAYGGAGRTLRWAGRGPQPQNLPAKGPGDSWGLDDVEFVLGDTMDFEGLTCWYSNPLAAVSGCLRGLFSAAPGHDLICSDFSAIEAVVIAELAGESWRQEVFRTHGKIYEMSTAKITGIPFEEIMAYPAAHKGEHHPLRKPIGKTSELASQYGGWIGAWKAFGADKYFNRDAEIRDKILAWRAQSPAIVEFWGGQVREDPPGSYQFRRELYGLEGAAVRAILNPGSFQDGRWPLITYVVKNDILYCQLPSGRCLAYHRPQLAETLDRYSKMPIYQITYEGWNADYKKGPRGWLRLETYGGKLAENVTQAVARDLLAYSMLAVERAGYPIVLHVHDEIVSEVSEGVGSVEEFEAIMSAVPPWATGWPVRAAGGWRGKRYRKD